MRFIQCQAGSSCYYQGYEMATYYSYPGLTEQVEEVKEFKAEHEFFSDLSSVLYVSCLSTPQYCADQVMPWRCGLKWLIIRLVQVVCKQLLFGAEITEKYTVCRQEIQIGTALLRMFLSV